MNVLPTEKKIAAIAALTEGVSIRATERLTGIHRDTIMRLGVKIGQGCAALHDSLFRNLNVAMIECDEIWSYVAKKEKRVAPKYKGFQGDQYTFTALDATSKAIIAYRVGRRELIPTRDFMADLRMRVLNRPQINTDAFKSYHLAVEAAFGSEVDYGQIVKHYRAVGSSPEASRRYSPTEVVKVERKVIQGLPRRISTSYVERSNLTFRMQSRRFTRLTNGFSKKLENHVAAVGLFIAHYNLCRVHEAHRVTPAMQLGVTDHVWSIAELIEAAETGAFQAKRVGSFTVIDGGRV